jgi:hypothetical protein
MAKTTEEILKSRSGAQTMEDILRSRGITPPKPKAPEPEPQPILDTLTQKFAPSMQAERNFLMPGNQQSSFPGESSLADMKQPAVTESPMPTMGATAAPSPSPMPTFQPADLSQSGSIMSRDAYDETLPWYMRATNMLKEIAGDVKDFAGSALYNAGATLAAPALRPMGLSQTPEEKTQGVSNFLDKPTNYDTTQDRAIEYGGYAGELGADLLGLGAASMAAGPIVGGAIYGGAKAYGAGGGPVDIAKGAGSMAAFMGVAGAGSRILERAGVEVLKRAPAAIKNSLTVDILNKIFAGAVGGGAGAVASHQVYEPGTLPSTGDMVSGIAMNAFFHGLPGIVNSIRVSKANKQNLKNAARKFGDKTQRQYDRAQAEMDPARKVTIYKDIVKDIDDVISDLENRRFVGQNKGVQEFKDTLKYGRENISAQITELEGLGRQRIGGRTTQARPASQPITESPLALSRGFDTALPQLPASNLRALPAGAQQAGAINYTGQQMVRPPEYRGAGPEAFTGQTMARPAEPKQTALSVGDRIISPRGAKYEVIGIEKEGYRVRSEDGRRILPLTRDVAENNYTRAQQEVPETYQGIGPERTGDLQYPGEYQGIGPERTGDLRYPRTEQPIPGEVKDKGLEATAKATTNPAKFTKGIVSLNTKDGMIDVPGSTYKGLTVHKDIKNTKPLKFGNYYGVTHAQSGILAGAFNTERQARMFAQILGDSLDFTKSLDGVLTDEVKTFINDVRNWVYNKDNLATVKNEDALTKGVLDLQNGGTSLSDFMDKLSVPGNTVSGFTYPMRYQIMQELLKGATEDNAYIKIDVKGDGTLTIRNSAAAIAPILDRLNIKVEKTKPAGMPELKRGEQPTATQADKPTTTQADKPTKVSRPKAEPASTQPGGITDFGEKIGGAKKDMWAMKGLGVKDLESMTDREADKYVTKDAIWPKLDYEAIVDSGVPAHVAYVVKTIRDSLPSKIPSTTNKEADKERRIKYITFIQQARDALANVKTESDLNNLFDRMFVDNGYYNRNDGSISKIGSWTDKQKDMPFITNIIAGKFRVNSWDIETAKRQVQKTKWPAKVDTALKGFDVRLDATKGDWFITKGRTVVKDGFKTKDEAENFLRETNKKQQKQEPELPQLKNLVYKGEDFRSGENISGQDLLDAFGFRGGEFGNWNSQKERQESLNWAYEALMDLADVLGIAPKDISLGSEMGIAFGARGSGGKRAAAAHYEPTKLVINLTKMKGAGTLAHEWFHALDDFLGRLSGDKKSSSPFLTQGRTRSSKLSTQVLDAFDKVVQATRRKQMTREDLIAQTEDSAKSHTKRMKSWLERLPDGMKTPTYKYQYNRKTKQRDQITLRGATDKEVEQAKALIEKIINDDNARKNFDKLVELHKDIRGGMDKDTMEQADNYIRWRDINTTEIKRLRAGGDLPERYMDTDYLVNAKKIDGRSKPYWSEPIELVARAFGSYIQDTLGHDSHYLVHSHDNAVYKALQSLGVLEGLPYPEGAERKAINEAFKNLFDAIKKDGTVFSGEESTFRKPLEKTGKMVYNKSKAEIKSDLEKNFPGVEKEGEVLDQTAEAIKDLGKTEANSIPDSRRADSGARIIGKSITAELVEKGKIDIKGRKVKDIHELAAIAQVYRDPRFETVRYVFVKRGKVVHYEGVTSMIPFETQINPFLMTTTEYREEMKATGLTPDEIAARDHGKWLDELNAITKRVGADGYYIIHNHPAGKMKPSSADEEMTKHIADAVPGFKGHLIINFNQYVEMQYTAGEGLTYTVHTKEFSKTDKLVSTEHPHPLLNSEISNTTALADAAMSIKNSKDYTAVIHLSNQNTVTGIEEIPDSMLRDAEALKEYLRTRNGSFGSRMSAIVFKKEFRNDAEVFSLAKELVSDGYTLDVLFEQDGGGYRSLTSTLHPTLKRQSGYWMGKDTNEYPVQRLQEEQARYNAKPFFSKLQQTLSDKMPNKADPNTIYNLISKNGVKQEEVKWSGLVDFLRGKEKVDKKELLEFLRMNELQIEEISTGENPRYREKEKEIIAAKTKRMEEIFDGCIKLLNDLRDEYYMPKLTTGEELLISGADDVMGAVFRQGADDFSYYRNKGYISTEEIKLKRRNISELREEHAALESDIETIRIRRTIEPKYKAYQLDGGGSYRELLFTLPVKEILPEGITKKGDFYYDSVGSRVDTDFVRRIQPDQAQYRSSHWDEPNILAHTRFNDRIDSKGNRVLFIEEIQSDWHQEGRKQGYKPQNERALYDERNKLNNKLAAMNILIGKRGRPITQEERAEVDEANARIKEITQLLNGVPDAPFRKTWHEFVLKRLIRYAAENGYDKIAWTTGTQQNERYSLAKVVDTINAYKNEDGTYDVRAFDKGGTKIEAGSNKNFTKSQIIDMYGADVGGKIISDTDARGVGGDAVALSGKDLEVGGSGMKGFYDKIVPDFLNSYGKRWQAKVEDVVMPFVERGDGAYLTHKTQSFPITESMRESVLFEGQSLFEEPASYKVDPKEYKGFTDEKLEKEWREARIKTPNIFEKLRDVSRQTALSFARGNFGLLERGARYAELRQKLLQFNKSKDVALYNTLVKLKKIVGDLSPKEYQVFNDKVILDDLFETMQEGKAIPFFDRQEDLQKALAEIKPYVNDKVAEAIKIRKQEWEALRRQYIGALQAIGYDVADRFKRQNYFRHLVLEYANNDRVITGTGKKLRTPGMYQRRGSKLPILTDYLQAEAEAMARMHYDVDRAKMIHAIESSTHNILPQLKKQAKDKNFENLVGGPENVARINQLEGELAEIKHFGSGGDSERAAEIRAELSELDPTRPFKKKIAMAMNKLEKLGILNDAYQDPAGLFKYLSEINKKTGDWNIPINTIFKAIQEREAFIRNTLAEKFLVWEDIVPEGYVEWQAKEGNMLFTTYSIPDRIADQLMEGLLKDVVAEDLKLRKVRVQGAPYRQIVISEELAETLNNLTKPRDMQGIEKFVVALLRRWKQWQLISPTRWAKYNLRNISGDADHTFLGNPAGFKYVPQATKELYKVMIKGEEMTPMMKKFFERGGMSNFLQVAEMGDLNQLKMFLNTAERRLSLANEQGLAKTAGKAVVYGVDRTIKGYWKAARLTTDMREAVLRYANFLSYVEQIKTGKLTNYGGSIPEEIKAMSDAYDKAYKLSNELLGAYDDISTEGQYIRDRIIPFWSFQELNARFYTQAFKNTMQNHGFMAALGRAAVGKAIKIPFHVAANIGKYVLGMFGLTMLMELYNQTFHSEQEKNLPSSVKQRAHLNFGEWGGDSYYFSRLGSASEVMDWFGLGTPMADIQAVLNGKKSLKEQALDMAKSPVNKVVGSVNPFGKTIVELFMGQSLYPDAFKRRTLRDKVEYVFGSVGLGNEYRAATGKPTKGNYFSRIPEYFVYRTDPKEAAYNHIMEEKYRFLQQKGINLSRMIDFDAKSNALYNLKKALKYKDSEAAEKYLIEYAMNGGTAQGLNNSIQSMRVFSKIPKELQAEFVAQMTAEDIDKLILAQQFYSEVLGEPEE